MGTKTSRVDKMSEAESLFKEMEANLENPFWKSKYDILKAENQAYIEVYNKREMAKQKRVEAMKKMEDVDNELISFLSKLSKAILIEIDKSDLKVREFFINGNVSNIMSSTHNKQIVSINHLVKGFENNPDYEFVQKYGEKLKELSLKLDEAYKTLVSLRDAETSSIKDLKEADDDYDSLLRKTRHFIKNERS
ncbi:hypothetical protein JXR93_12485 [bacterium]|nr:hypothetical protein [bacterium]